MSFLPTLFLLVATTLAPTSQPRNFQPAATPLLREDLEFEKRKTEAGNDTTKLWSLYEWCQETKRTKGGKATLKKLLKIDPSHKEANLAQGNVFHDGKWFANQQKVDEYKLEREAAEKTAQGLVLWKDQWVPAEDLPFLDRGLTRDPSGNWVDPEVAKKLEEGWVQQDLTWIPPAEKEKVEQGLWKCDDEWLPIAEADTFHSEIGQWWQIPFERFHLYTTCERDVVNQKLHKELEGAYDELIRAYGTKPQLPIVVIVLRDEDQYKDFAGGNEAAYREPTDVRGLSSVHYAYFADQNFDLPEVSPVLGVGVGFWDSSTQDGNRWGVHSVRHALGLSFGEALDPSPRTVEKTAKTPMKQEQFWDSFYAEKRIPTWMRYGAAAYAERYYRDNAVGTGGDPLWARKWSVANIQARGGLRQLKQILDFNLTVEGGVDSEKLINESGLVMAFLLDGGNADATEKLKRFQVALTTGKDKKDLGEAEKALDAAILKHEADLKKFAGL
jgi:hypothetical protein